MNDLIIHCVLPHLKLSDIIEVSRLHRSLYEPIWRQLFKLHNLPTKDEMNKKSFYMARRIQLLHYLFINNGIFEDFLIFVRNFDMKSKSGYSEEYESHMIFDMDEHLDILTEYFEIAEDKYTETSICEIVFDFDSTFSDQIDKSTINYNIFLSPDDYSKNSTILVKNMNDCIQKLLNRDKYFFWSDNGYVRNRRRFDVVIEANVIIRG